MSRTMSLSKFGVCLVVVVLFICFHGSICAVFHGTENFVVVQGGEKANIIETVENNRTIVNNATVLARKYPGDSGGEKEDITTLVEDSRKMKKNKNQQGFMQRILPMMIIPFVVSTSFIPILLATLKILILKSAFIGKIGILLMLLNVFRRRTSGEGGVFDHNLKENDVAMEYYGYHGDEEYGAYVNRRKRKRRNIA